MNKNFHCDLFLMVRQYIAVAGAGAGVKIMDKGGAEKEPEPKTNNYGFATMVFSLKRTVLQDF